MDDQNPTKKVKGSKATETITNTDLMNTSVDENVQKMINKPQADPTGVSDEDKVFMDNVMKLIEDGVIDLYKPMTLMNEEIYNKLDEKAKGIADKNALPLLGDIRNIKNLIDAGLTDTYQIQNLIQRTRLTKERIEGICGDVYII